MARVDRFDFGARLRADKRTEQGGARVPARLSRIGVQEYRDSTGKTLREYRPPGAVFDPASLKTFETATLTDGHPQEVTPENWRSHAVGFVLNPHVDSQRYVGADLVIQDAATLKKIDSGDLVELSCGYSCTLVMGEGVSPEGEHYDAKQTELRINHIALLPVGAARGGPAVKLHLDSARASSAAISVWVLDDDRRVQVPRMSPDAILGALAGGWRP